MQGSTLRVSRFEKAYGITTLLGVFCVDIAERLEKGTATS